jgi:hypothetical protein
MRVGVIFTIYGCEEYVDRCLKPWFDLSSEFNFIFTVTSGRFKDYVDLGVPDRNYNTLKKLVEWEFNYMSITRGDKLLDEDSSRNRCLDFLKPYNCDLIWLVDGDEFYTEKDIRNIISFVNSTPEAEAYSIWLKNYTIKIPLFSNFLRPTLYRNRAFGGIARFYFDSYFSYADGIHQINDVEKIAIPPEFAFIEHNSWLPSQSTKDKIKYQEKRYCGPNGDFPLKARCSFVWNEEYNKLDFNRDFYSFYGLQIPVLKEMGQVYSFKFNLDFNRENITILINNTFAENEHVFEILDLHGNHLGNYNLYLSPGVNLWINPSSFKHFDSDPSFNGFKINVYNGSSLIHEENLHIKC